MKVFGSVRGSFFIEPMKAQAGIISISDDKFKIPTEGALVSNFAFSDREKSSITQCFNNVNHIYAFGHDPENSGFSITYLVFLGERCMEEGFKDSGNLYEVVNSYNNLRVSESKKTIDVSFGDNLVMVAVILSMEVSVFDAELNAVTFTISGKTLITGKPSSKKPSGKKGAGNLLVTR